jgi:hypothetical protein
LGLYLGSSAQAGKQNKALEPSDYPALASPLRLAPKLPRALLEHRVAPIGSDIQERPEHEGTLMSQGMGQHQGAAACPGELGLQAMPVSDQAAVIDDIDIERARSPGPAAPSPSPSLDRFQHSEQRFWRKARVDQCYRVYVNRLTRAADGFRLVKWRHRKDFYISALNFA